MAKQVLSVEKLKFAYYWVISGGKNATEIVQQIHPKIKRSSANARVATYLKDPKVKELITDLQLRSQGTKDAVVAKAKEILNELDLISFFDPRKMFDIGTEERDMLDKLGDSARAVSRIKITRKKYTKKMSEATGVEGEVEMDVHVNNKIEALKLYGAHHKLYAGIAGGEGEIKSPVWSIPDNGGSSVSGL
jgi:hypothetical protein